MPRVGRFIAVMYLYLPSLLCVYAVPPPPPGALRFHMNIVRDRRWA